MCSVIESIFLIHVYIALQNQQTQDNLSEWLLSMKKTKLKCGALECKNSVHILDEEMIFWHAVFWKRSLESKPQGKQMIGVLKSSKQAKGKPLY